VKDYLGKDLYKGQLVVSPLGSTLRVSIVHSFTNQFVRLLSLESLEDTSSILQLEKAKTHGHCIPSLVYGMTTAKTPQSVLGLKDIGSQTIKAHKLIKQYNLKEVINEETN
jgi:hypothetical protein